MGRNWNSSPSSDWRGSGDFGSIYVDAGKVGPSTTLSAVVSRFSHRVHVNPPLDASSPSGDTSLFVLEYEVPALPECCRSGGDLAVGAVSDPGVSVSGVKAACDAAPGGRDGRAFSLVDNEPLVLGFGFVLFRLLAISAS